MEASWGIEGTWSMCLGQGLASVEARKAVLEAIWGMQGIRSRRSGCGFRQFRKQSGSWKAADGGSLIHWGQRWRQFDSMGAA